MADQLNETQTRKLFSKQAIYGICISHCYVPVEINVLVLLSLTAGAEHDLLHHFCNFISQKLDLIVLTS